MVLRHFAEVWLTLIYTLIHPYRLTYDKENVD